MKALGYIEATGLTLTLLAAVGRLVPTFATWAGPAMAVAALLLVVGRFLQPPLHERYARTDPRELTLRRLYHQRVFGAVALVMAATLLCLPTGFYAGVYLGPSSWLVPFIFFTITEVYSTFRISAIIDKENDKK